MEDGLRDMWSSVATFVPKLAAFLVILIVGWIVAKLVAKAVDKILERVGFDRAVERGGVRKALARSQYDASTIASKIVYYALLLFVLQLAFGVFGPNPIGQLIAGVIAFLPKLFVALVIIVVASAIAAAVRDLLANTLSGLSYGRMLANIASVFILGLGIIAALNQVGVAITVTLPVLVAILATIGGILVVGVGGGLIRPMQDRWDGYLSRAEEESRNIREQASRRHGAGSNRSGQMPAMSSTAYSPAPSAAQQPPTTPQSPQYGGGYQQPQHAQQPDQQGGYGQQYPEQQYPGQQYPGQQYPEQQYPPSGGQPGTGRGY
jgi:Conserved TM helix